MINLHRFVKTIGLDKSIAYSSGSRIIQGFAGICSMFFISLFLTGVEQGFYFTFGSILALQVFFELGLTGIMTQYVAHEVSHLRIDDNKEYQGDILYKSRLASLVRFCVKWYLILAAHVFVLLLVVGNIYFTKFGDTQSFDVNWRTPWILICVATSIQLFISPITSILTGLGFVKETSKISFYQQLITPLSIWLGFALGIKLYVTGLGYLITIFIWLFFVRRLRLHQVLINLWNTEITEKVVYKNEIFPYQWRIALSWVSGYFIFQLFNPVLFATEGAVVAGQMGMTLQALNAISAFSMSWLNTKIPLYSRLIALKDYVKLDSIFNTTLKQMNIICGLLLSSFFFLIYLIHFFSFKIGDTLLSERFLDFLPLLLMMIPVFLNQYVNSWATYLRCHKQEPFLLNSVIIGILCLLSTFILGNLYGLYGITIGYFTIKTLTLPWGYYIFKSKKSQWHEQ